MPAAILPIIINNNFFQSLRVYCLFACSSNLLSFESRGKIARTKDELESTESMHKSFDCERSFEQRLRKTRFSASVSGRNSFSAETENGGKDNA